MDRELLNKIANADYLHFDGNEQNVKYNIVLKLLNAFGYDKLDLEHAAQGSRVDINIGNKIIVETKAFDKNLDNYVLQLKEYCDTERPFLAILTNGRQFRFYSPLMRVRDFADTLIYELSIKDFAKDEVVERINKIIGIENFKNETYITFIEEREKELKQIKEFLSDFDKRKSEDIQKIKTDISQLESEIEKLNSEIRLKQQEIEQIKSKQQPEKEELYNKHFVPMTSEVQPVIIPTTLQLPIIQPIPTDGKTYTIDSPKEGVKAYGQFYDSKRFKVLKGSTVSISTDDSFGKGAADGGYKRRKELEKSGIINSNRQFNEDYVFNSISQVACVVLGGSRSGPKEWK
ncbi:MAG: DUF4357 domain-containing protein [Candidatus Brocadia sp.]|jgi:hypothetical protein